MIEVGALIRRLPIVIAISLAAPSCVRDSDFVCSRDSECGGTGRCEDNDFCSFPDPSCADGRRFGDWSGSVTNQCVDVQNTTGCPSSYAEPSGGGGGDFTGGAPAIGGHRYRVLSGTATWASQRDACAADGANIYLAIIDDGSEFSDISRILSGMSSSTKIWVGVDDQATEGSYVTVLGAPATYLPWASSEPDGLNANCVAATKGSGSSSRQFSDEDCAALSVAVCECEPSL